MRRESAAEKAGDLSCLRRRFGSGAWAEPGPSAQLRPVVEEATDGDDDKVWESPALPAKEEGLQKLSFAPRWPQGRHHS